MSSPEGLRHEVPFLVASTVPREFRVVGRLIRVRMHYGYHCAGGRWCSGRTCAACRDGYQAEFRTLWRLEDSSRAGYLWESRPRLDGLAAEVAELQRTGQTADVEIWRDREARNAPISARILRVVAYRDLYDLRMLADAVYQPPLRIAEPPDLGSDRVGSLVGGSEDTRVPSSGVDPAKVAAADREWERVRERMRERRTGGRKVDA